MSARNVPIADVTVDPACTKSQRVRYKVQLQCGCRWWEDRDASAGPPPMLVANCYAPHSAGVRWLASTTATEPGVDTRDHQVRARAFVNTSAVDSARSADVTVDSAPLR